jgi:hypothetical protein
LYGVPSGSGSYLLARPSHLNPYRAGMTAATAGTGPAAAGTGTAAGTGAGAGVGTNAGLSSSVYGLGAVSGYGATTAPAPSWFDSPSGAHRFKLGRGQEQGSDVLETFATSPVVDIPDNDQHQHQHQGWGYTDGGASVLDATVTDREGRPLASSVGSAVGAAGGSGGSAGSGGSGGEDEGAQTKRRMRGPFGIKVTHTYTHIYIYILSSSPPFSCETLSRRASLLPRAPLLPLLVLLQVGGAQQGWRCRHGAWCATTSTHVTHDISC